jgi:hypothetical protein
VRAGRCSVAAARIIACCISSATSASFDARERAGVRLCITAPTEGTDPERRKAGGEARRSVEEYTPRRPVEAGESRTTAVECRSPPRRSLWGTPLRTTSALSSLFTPTCARQSLCWLEYREDPSTHSVLQPLQPNTTHSLAQTHNRTFMRTRTLYARPPALCPRAHTRTHASTQPNCARAHAHRRAQVVDTSVLYPHVRGPPCKNALRHLAKKYLGTTIQQVGKAGTAEHGRQGPKWE